MSYGFTRQVDLSFDQAVQRVTAELQKEGFGVLTEIDVQATMKKKLNAQLNHYKILGACNPPLAYQALTIEPLVGLLLPCNVVVFEDKQGQTVVSAIDAEAMMSVVDRPEIVSLAEEVNKKLKRVIENV